MTHVGLDLKNKGATIAGKDIYLRTRVIHFERKAEYCDVNEERRGQA